MELCSIASGSSGNCICVGSDDCHVLIDAGISGKRIENGLNSIDLKTADMQGILITHEHIDHIAGLGVQEDMAFRCMQQGKPLMLFYIQKPLEK